MYNMKKVICNIAFAIGLAGITHAAYAQNMIANTNQIVMNTAVQSTMNTGGSRPSEPPQVMYRERVPGKPEEGFVPVTQATSSRFTTTTVEVRGYGSVAVLSDNTKNVTCYILDPLTSPDNNISCVSNK